MTLGIFLSFGESFRIQKQHGQDARFVSYYLARYAKHFDKVYVFSWENETYLLPDRVELVSNRYHIPKYIYAFLLPFIERKRLSQCAVLRLMQFTAIVPAVIAQLLLGAKIVSTYGFRYPEFFAIDGKPIRAFFTKALEFLFSKSPDAFIATTHATEQFLMQRGIRPQDIFFIPNGVDVELFKPSRHALDKNKVKILFVGRLEKQKNLKSLILAIAGSKYKNAIKLIFIGNGALKETLVALAKKSSVALEIIDPVAHDKLPSYYQSADIFTLVSEVEGHPKALIEAMACGLPCVASDYAGHNEIALENETAIITRKDPESIKVAIDKLISQDSLREKIARGAREYAEKNFDIKKLLGKEIELLKQIK